MLRIRSVGGTRSARGAVRVRREGSRVEIGLFASVVASAQIGDGFDYVDLSYFHEDRPDLPRSYGGISGSGL